MTRSFKRYSENTTIPATPSFADLVDHDGVGNAIVAQLRIHNTTVTAQNLLLYMPPAAGGSPGTPSTANLFFNGAVDGDDDRNIIPAGARIVLPENGDSIRAQAATADKLFGNADGGLDETGSPFVELAAAIVAATSAAALFTHSSATTKTVAHWLLLHNRRAGTTVFTLWRVPNNGASAGTADDTNESMVISLAQNETLWIELDPMVLEDVNDTIQAKADFVDSINMWLFGVVE